MKGSERKKERPIVKIDSFIDLGLKNFISSIDEAAAYAVFSEQVRRVVARRTKFPEIGLPLMFGNPQSSPKARVFKNYGNLNQRYALVAAFSATETFLLSPYLSLSFALRARTNNGLLQLREMQDIQKSCVREAKRKHIWWSLSKLAKNEGIKFSWNSYFSTLISMRNLLAHSQGAVSSFDVGSDGLLKITWKRPNMYVGKKKIDKLPVLIEKGGRLSFKYRKIQRKYRPGDSLKINLKDARDIIWTLMMFGLEVGNLTKKHVHKMAKEWSH